MAGRPPPENPSRGGVAPKIPPRGDSRDTFNWTCNPRVFMVEPSPLWPEQGSENLSDCWFSHPPLRNRHRIYDFCTEVIKKSGQRTVRAGRPDGLASFLTADPANVEHILKTNFENYPKGKFSCDNLRPLLGNGIFNADNDLWKIQRKVASHEFTTRSLRDFALENAAEETTSRLIPVLSDACKRAKQLDLQDIFSRFAFDNICQLSFGIDPACLDISLPRIPFAEAFDLATLCSLKRLITFPRLLWQIKDALNLGTPKLLRDAVRDIDEFAKGIIKNRREELAAAAAKGDDASLGGRSDLLSRFMTLVDNDPSGEFGLKAMEDRHDKTLSKGNEFSDVFLRDIIISFVLAGRDTLTAALSWFFWLLSLHPKVEEAILEEIWSILRARPSAENEGKQEEKNSIFTYEELKTMNYLHAALSESMRLYPPVPVDFKTARNADVLPDGTVIHPNDIVEFHIFAMGRLEELWGEDCMEFKPERWLKDGVFVPQSPYKYPVFQAGPRICLGKDMVMLQMKLVCTAVLVNFDISVPKDYKAKYLPSLTMRIKYGLPVTLKPRSNGMETM